MSAQLQPPAPQALRLVPMTIAMVDAVALIEQQAYAFPWSRGNFIDSLAAGYRMQVLQAADGELIGYTVAMIGVDEVHLLNITVAPRWQRQGHGQALLDAVVAQVREVGLPTLLLEVRTSNDGARLMYERAGFLHIGLRKGYYPAPQGQREDAFVMAMAVEARDVD